MGSSAEPPKQPTAETNALPLVLTDQTTTVEVHSLADCLPDLDLLPVTDRDRYHSFKNELAAERFVRRQSELRRRLAHYTGQAPASIRLGVEDDGRRQGKPFLIDQEGTPATLQFNLSSSDGLMALAVDATRPVGVDIECHSLHQDLSARSLAPALHPVELERLAADDLEDTLQCWVYKEAWIKWTGEGMRADLKGLELWHPGLAERFTHHTNAVRLTRLETEVGAAWIGLVKPLTGGPRP